MLHQSIHTRKWIHRLLLQALLVLLAGYALAQELPPPGLRGNRQTDAQGRPLRPGMQGGDSLERRDRNEDSITIYFRMFDSSRVKRIDSSLSDFTLRFPLPADYLYLGNLGSAAKSLLFTPNTSSGYDPGFHAFDVYNFTLANTRLFNTTRPYTELDYLLGARSEQTIKVLHTQNIRPLWNATFDYRLINAPGNFKNMNASHSNMRFSSDFVSENRRYSGVFVYIRNRSRVNENGGIRSDSFLKSDNPAYFERFNIPTWLGGDEQFNTNFFSSNLAAGNNYGTQTLFFRHQYDLGQKDSTFTEDSAIIRRFYPRLRLQHNMHYQKRTFEYDDEFTNSPAVRDDYQTRYGILPVNVPLNFHDEWREFSNEAAIVLFPQKTNQDQYFKAGAAFQALRGSFGPAIENFNGIYLLGEYRNRTRNRKWDINANGKFFLTGPYIGNYNASATLQTDLGSRLGALRLGFQNINRTPSFVFDARSNFLIEGTPQFNAENYTILSGDLYIPRLGVHLLARYTLISNYTYWNDYYRATQDASLQNVLHIGGEKKFRITNRWNLYAELHLQQSSGGGINLPLIYTRNRLAYEGIYAKNLTFSTGLEVRYFSPFTADDWSPFNGQWVVQGSETIKNFPDIAAFFHFRISSFRAFFRAENLNTASFRNGFSWTNNNLAAPLYPTPGFILRIGIYWSFVN